MPIIYSSMSGQVTTSCNTNATPNTENDVWSMKPGSRNASVQAMYVGGKGAGLTALSGIAYRIKKWGTATSTGTSITSTARDPGSQAPKHAILVTNAALPTSGSGGPTFMGGCVSGAAGPGGWVAPNPDSIITLEGSTTSSLDLFTHSGTASLLYEFSIEIVE